MTDRPATWKVVTVSVAMAGLGVLGASAANAEATAPGPQVGFVAMDDDWTDTYWNNSWHGDHDRGDWTETYWDD